MQSKNFLIKITKEALEERKRLDAQLSDPDYWSDLVDRHCSKPEEDNESLAR